MKNTNLWTHEKLVWLWCMLCRMAAKELRVVAVGPHNVAVDKGQILTTRRQLAIDLGVSEGSLRRSLESLEAYGVMKHARSRAKMTLFTLLERPLFDAPCASADGHSAWQECSRSESASYEGTCTTSWQECSRSQSASYEGTCTTTDDDLPSRALLSYHHHKKENIKEKDRRDETTNAGTPQPRTPQQRTPRPPLGGEGLRREAVGGEAPSGEDMTVDEALWTELMGGRPIWTESMCRRFRMTTSELRERMMAFRSECLCRALPAHKDMRDLQTHFFFWLQLQASRSAAATKGPFASAASSSGGRNQAISGCGSGLSHLILRTNNTSKYEQDVW